MNKMDQKEKIKKIVAQNSGDLIKICRNLSRFSGENGEKTDVALKYVTGFLDGLKVRYSLLDGEVPCIHAIVGKNTGIRGIYKGSIVMEGENDICSGAGVLLFVLKLAAAGLVTFDGSLDFYFFFGKIPEKLPEIPEKYAFCMEVSGADEGHVHEKAEALLNGL